MEKKKLLKFCSGFIYSDNSTDKVFAALYIKKKLEIDLNFRRHIYIFYWSKKNINELSRHDKSKEMF